MKTGFFDIPDDMNDAHEHDGYFGSDEEGFDGPRTIGSVQNEDAFMTDHASAREIDSDIAKIGQDPDCFARRGFFSMSSSFDEPAFSPLVSESASFGESVHEEESKQKGGVIMFEQPKPKGVLIKPATLERPVPGQRRFFDVQDSDAGLPTAPVNGVMGLIQLSKLCEHYDRDTLNKEFSILFSEDLKLNVSRLGSLASESPDNVKKNRYTNILAFDHSRVLLKQIPGVDHSDFINANWICGVRDDESVDEHNFIATQGPIPETFQDFWRMIWETGAKYIVFLGREVEKGMLKVDRYWPCVEADKAIIALPWENDQLFGSSHSFYGGSFFVEPEEKGNVMTGPYMTITAVKEELTGISGVIKRTFLLAETKNPGVTREIYQYQYGGWPDNGAPSSSEPIRNLVREIHTARGNDPAPIIVHCSAGVGRTGAFCTIYTHVLRILRYIQRRKDIVSTEPSPVKKPRDGSLSGSGSQIIPDTLRRSGSLLKTNLASQRFHRDESSSSCLSPSVVSPLQISSSSSFLDEDETLTFNVYQTVLSLRRCRSGMVQNLDQYMFCYKAIIDELRDNGLLPSDAPKCCEETGQKTHSEIVKATQDKVEIPPPLSPTLRNPFSSRQSLLTSIDLGFLNTSTSQKPNESSCFDAEFHPSPTQEGSLVKSTLLTQSAINPVLTSSTIHTNPLVPDSRRTPPLRSQNSVHSTTGRAIPIRPRVQPLLQQQSPTLVSKPVLLNEDSSRVAVIIRPIGKPETTNDGNDGSLSDNGNGNKKERIKPTDFLSRSAISPSLTILSTSAPAHHRNPVLLGRSTNSSPGEISSPV